MNSTAMKQVKKIYKGSKDWVGDGFPVTRPAIYRDMASFSPFLMLDHAGPQYFEPSLIPRGVDEHPHRGFETVTLVFQGAVEHRDSVGNYGKLYAGDVQWMTAAGGIVHEEKHENEFSKSGGTLEIIQLWVNLPKEFKMSEPRYQDINSKQFPKKEISEGVELRVVAGEFEGLIGAAKTFTPLVIADLTMKQSKSAKLNATSGDTFSIYVLQGEISAKNSESIHAGDLALFEREGTDVELTATKETKLVILSGKPINEPIATYGPFVMNTQEEIWQAVADYQSGRMGSVNPREFAK